MRPKTDGILETSLHVSDVPRSDPESSGKRTSSFAFQ